MIVDIDGLTVVFGGSWRRAGHRALDAVSLQIEEGDAFAFVGPNGAGKSTAVYCILGLLRPTSGCARVFGRELEPGDPLFRDIAFLPEEPHYHDYLTVEEAVQYYATLHGATLSSAGLTRALEQVRLDNARTKRVAACSKGMKQKVGIAQCLLHQPRLLILDEPLRGLDPVTVKEIRDVLIDLNRQGVTIVMNSHLLAEVELLATRVAILSNGKLLALKRIDELTGQDSDTYAIEVDGIGPLPDYFTIERMVNGRVRGTIPARRVYEFMELARVRGAAVRHCSIKKQTLEESFLAVVSGNA